MWAVMLDTNKKDINLVSPQTNIVCLNEFWDLYKIIF